MFRPTFRIASSASPLSRAALRAPATKRFVSTAPPHQKSRSWRNGAARWALAGGLVYYYNTATVFAEEPVSIHTPPETSRENEQYDTIASISEQRKAQSRSQAAPLPSDTQSQTVKAAPNGEATAADGSPEALEEEAEQQGAFNEETGEINWDCPCLGGMAYGPCGEEFRAAFSCFVFSKEEPKGVDCIDKFKGMQNCFRDHPDIYGGELEDEGGEGEIDEGAAVEQEEGRSVSVAREPVGQEARSVEARSAEVGSPLPNGEESAEKGQEKERVRAATEQVRSQTPIDESDQMVPKAWHDGRSANEKE